ncbi:MAG: hypothetical protein WDO18_16200 [Acidobacteriota bacterium]
MRDDFGAGVRRDGARGGGRPEPGARLEQLQQRLQLTEDQRNQIRPILQDEAAKLRGIRDKYAGQDSRRSRLRLARELQGVQKDIDKKIKPILTKQQHEEWTKIREERRQQVRERKQF